ncbi:EpsG family protein [Acetobacterium wieringae]|uniref:EpsG family protein n=1 Tax=Acetobacterium wieringae TaxID=52694 RepID=A0A5D0WH00_9FIRM|nr:EpsG family protein [Acetobacterium wieringae]TYC82198.1 EpsG family protein [Acetobacterium wieringae]
MSYIISGMLICGNYISTLIKGRGKLFSYLLIFFMWVLFWNGFGYADYLNYKNLYDYVSYTGTGYSTSQIGFVMMMKFMSSLGLEYYHFLMLLSFFGMFLIIQTVEKYTDKPQIVYLLYFVYPFLLDVVQVKHFFAMAIVIYCFRYLEQDGKRNIIKYIIGILLAFSVHSIAIIFLPLVFIKKMQLNKLYVVVILALLIGVPLAYTEVFQNIATIFVPFQRIEDYFINRAKFGFFIQFLIQGIIILMIRYSRTILERRGEGYGFVELIYKINLYLIMLFPLYIINGTFERGFRMIAILNYIVFSKLFSTSKKKEKVEILVILSIFAFSMFAYYIFIPYQNTVFFPIFENNLFF